MADFPAMHQYSLHLLQHSRPLASWKPDHADLWIYPAIGRTKIIYVQLGSYNFRFLLSMVPSIEILDARACWYQVKSTVSNSANVDSLPVFLFLHALPHFCICSRISFFLANIEFNVLADNPSHFAMSTHFSAGFFSYFLNYFQSVVQSSHMLLRLSLRRKKIN